MRNDVKPWPQGETVSSQEFYSLEDELFEVLEVMGMVSTDFIKQFLQDKFQKEDVTIERRSFMRYLSRDLRFNFEGSTRSRTVRVADLDDLERTSGWLEISDSIINYMISLAVKEGIGATTSKEDICQHFKYLSGHSYLGHSEIALDHAIEMLMRERRIEGRGVYNVKEAGRNSIGWSQGGYVGISTGGKKSGGLHLPSRSWEVAKEICKELNGAQKEAMRMFMLQYGDIRKMDPLAAQKAMEDLMVRMHHPEKMDIFDELTDNPILKLALWSGGNYAAADIVEIAIEVLRSVYSIKDSK